MMMPMSSIKIEPIGQPLAMSKTQNKSGKIRRTRQPRNPQLSVARRNERERNRVKMVNNGFALLRNHLPFDESALEESGSETPTPGGKPLSGSSSKGKKFSKVETLRAAIQHIRMLENLIRTQEPEFESMNIVNSSGSASGSQMASMYDEVDGCPLSVGEPLSCSSAHSNSTSTNQTHQDSLLSQLQIRAESSNISVQAGSSTYMGRHLSADSQNHQEQFIKLKPQHHQIHHNHNHHQHQQQQHSIPSPQNHPAGQSLANGSQPQSQFSVPPSESQAQSHTHIWIEQHQNSFMEQQQLYNQQTNQNGTNESQANWTYQQTSPHQHQVESGWQYVESPSSSSNGLQMMHPPQHQQTSDWYGSAGLSPDGSGHNHSHQNHQSLPSASPVSQYNSQVVGSHSLLYNQQHQISLYSQ